MEEEMSVKTYNGKFFDLMDMTVPLIITDYKKLKKDIIIDENSGEIMLGNKKERKKITSIEELMTNLEELIIASVKIFYAEMGMDFSELDKKRLVEQLVFDVLFDKYLKEEKEISLLEYSREMAKSFYSEEDQTSTSDAIRKKINRGLESRYERLRTSEIREQLEQLGIGFDIYTKYYNPKQRESIKSKKPIYIWDSIYYNCNMLTAKQFARNLKRDSNNSYGDILQQFVDYNEFVKKLLPEENESPKKYYKKIMRFYVLESYKRIDYIFKLMGILSESELSKIDKEDVWVKRFHPQVLVPYEDNGKLEYTKQVNYYKGLLMIEDGILNKKKEGKEYGAWLIYYQIIRAKVYELFNYHAEFETANYKIIKEFIKNSYNLKEYHESIEKWKIIEKIEKNKWDLLDNETKKVLKKDIKEFVSINSAFWG